MPPRQGGGKVNPSPDSHLSPPPPASPYPPPDAPPPSPKEWYNLLDLTGSNHISRADLINALVLIAVYPKPAELDQLLAFVGDGRPESFLSSWNTDVPKPVLLSPLVLDGLRKNRDGSLYSELNRAHMSYGESCKWLYLAYFAFPFNLVFGRAWALKVLEESYFDVLWEKQYLRAGYVVNVLGVAMIGLGAWSNTSTSWTTVAIFFVLVVMLLTTQVLYEVEGSDPVRVATSLELQARLQALYYTPVTVESEATNARDFLLQAVNSDTFERVCVASSKGCNFESVLGRLMSRPSVVLASDVDAGIAGQKSQNKGALKKLSVAARESRSTYFAAFFIAASPLASLMFSSTRKGVPVEASAVAVASLFFVAKMAVMPKALPPLNQTVPRFLSNVLYALDMVNCGLRQKERGEENHARSHLSIKRDSKNVHAAVEILEVMRLYVTKTQGLTNSLSFLGTAVTLLMSFVAASKVVINPTVDEIFGSQVTLLCLSYALYGAGNLVRAVNGCIKVNNELTDVRAGIFNDIIKALSKKLVGENLDEATRSRLLDTRDLCEALRYDATHHPTTMKVLTIPVTKELRAKLFGLLISMALSMIVRLAQQYLM